MKQAEKKQVTKEDKDDEERVKEILEKAKTDLLNKDSSEKEIQKTTVNEETGREENVSELRNENELIIPADLKEKKLEFEEKIYSDDLEFAARLQEAITPIEKTKEEIDEKKLNDVFCEQTFKKKIIKKIFNKDEESFKNTTIKILNSPDWKSAALLIEELFDQNEVNFYSETAVKYVDIIENYFSNGNQTENKGSAAN